MPLQARRRLFAVHRWLYHLSLKGMGFNNWRTMEGSGELWAVQQLLPGLDRGGAERLQAPLQLSWAQRVAGCVKQAAEACADGPKPFSRRIAPAQVLLETVCGCPFNLLRHEDEHAAQQARHSNHLRLLRQDVAGMAGPVGHDEETPAELLFARRQASAVHLRPLDAE